MSKAEWCRRYAQINSVGLRKILKKHDKMCKNRAGQTYMQVRALLVDIAAPSHHSASFHVSGAAQDRWKHLLVSMEGVCCSDGPFQELGRFLLQHGPMCGHAVLLHPSLNSV